MGLIDDVRWKGRVGGGFVIVAGCLMMGIHLFFSLFLHFLSRVFFWGGRGQLFICKVFSSFGLFLL